ncbi:hypothetical protein DXX93_01055 [Thalassotalea euphylliae]|uniref:Phosphate ABC transporter substrate-binding protein n=1 Tax=Thalassotalea euphylliae TaxID=1655234 RepID=A0A3E0TM89_9GAMM|nr:hypothetical protein [Thalassotalea euphylliae]REL25282.1 hypothetical protein DXX93_01055 [Thalassotalea euphylliae]
MHRNCFSPPKIVGFTLVKRYLIWLLCGWTLCFAQLVLAADNYAIITLNQEFKTLSKGKARMLFRGKAKSLQGKPIELSDWPSETQIRNDFYQLLLGKDAAQMSAHWAGLSFSGKARPPKELKSSSIDDLMNWLAQKPTRIGYAPLETLPENVTVLYVVKKDASNE